MTEVTVSSSASEDLRRAAVWYANESHGLAAAFLDEFDQACAMIADSPDLGSPRGEGIRRLVMQRFPYSVYYRVEADRLLVLAVGHHRRHPSHWTRSR